MKKLGPGLAMFKPLSHYAQRERLDLRLSLILRMAICQDAWQLRHLGNPATVVFLLELDSELQGAVSVE